MKGELSNDELTQFMTDFEDKFKEAYRRALESGAVGETDIQEHHTSWRVQCC